MLRGNYDLNEVIGNTIQLGRTLTGHEALWAFLRGAIVETEGIVTMEGRMEMMRGIVAYVNGLANTETDEARTRDKLYGKRLLLKSEIQ